MKSRTSFFNFAVLRKNLQRCLPLIVFYTLVWAVAMPLNFISQNMYYAGRARQLFRNILELGQTLGSVGAITYALALTMVIFSYLYNARSANMIHAFPIRREGLFVTNYVSGLVAFFGPNILILLSSLLALNGKGAEALLQWFLMTGLEFIFFFSFAVLVAQLTGHIVALPILYAILNFVVIVLEMILSYMLPNWVYGMPDHISYSTMPFSPLAYILGETNCRYVGETAASYNGWEYLWILAAIGVVFAVIAFFLYRARKIESAGDTIAVPALRPVFKYCFSFGCAIVLGAAMVAVLNLNLRFGNHLAASICMVVGGFIGYFGSEMALQKKINVFSRGWIGFAVVSVVIIAIPLLCRVDAFGYSSYLPDRDDIVGVDFDYMCSDEFTADHQAIDAVYTLHKELIEHPPLYEENLNDPALTGGNRNFQISYKLKDGSVVLREYNFFITDNEWHLNYPLTEQVEDVMNQPALIALHYLPSVRPTLNTIVNAHLECYGIEGMEHTNYFELYPEDVLEVYEQVILPEVQAGKLFRTDYTFKVEDYEKYNISAEVPVPTVEVNDAKPSQDAYVYLSFRVSTTEGHSEYVSFTVHDQNTRTFQALCDLAIKYNAALTVEGE